MSDTIQGAIVGGVIGFVAAILAALLPLIFTIRYDRYRADLSEQKEYLAWLRGIVPECEDNRWGQI